MTSLKEDIEEFMAIPYGEIVKHVVKANKSKNYILKAMADMFPFGMKDEDKWDFYRSDKYSAYLFWKVMQELEENGQPVPQRLANIAVGHCTQPRILIYGCGTGLVALGLRGMDPANEDITIADIPGRYFEFLQYLSTKYQWGFKFVSVMKGESISLKQKYEIILYNSIPSDTDRYAVIQHLAAHVEDVQCLYLNADAPSMTGYRSPQIVQLEEANMEAVEAEGGLWRVWRKKFVPLQEEELGKSLEKVSEPHVFPTSIACLSTLPGTACGIATYTKMLADALSNHYPTGVFRDITEGVPKNALILASIEFGIFLDTKLLINPAYENNWKFAVWHTVMRDPFQGYTKYLKDIDTAYDAHIVHTIVQKAWLSKFVEKPIFIIPHGTLVWNPIPMAEAKAKLGFPQYMKNAFVFGFAADNKGLDELFQVANKVNTTIPDFRMIMSAGVNSASKFATEYTGNLRDNLKRLSSQSNGTVVLGKYLTEEEIDMFTSAADMLIFNYKTPPYVASASGAMKRVLAAGKPIICVDDNRLEDLVEGEHCLKFKSGDLDALAQCIETLLSNKKLADELGQNCRKLAERTSWEHTGEKFISIFGSTIKGFGQDYYDEAYFIGKQGGKKFTTPTGENKEWSYYNPDGEWSGAEFIMKAIKTLLNPREMLSVGEGRGTFCAYAQDQDIIATGIDFSKWAIEHPYPRAKGLVELGDVRDLKFKDASFALVFASDIMEHIYMDDLPNAISEIQRVAKKWIFFNIGASMPDDRSDDLIVVKTQLPPKDRLVTTVAGHVTVKSEVWWREKLGGNGWKFRDDLVADFRRMVPPEVLINWKCVLIVERI